MNEFASWMALIGVIAFLLTIAMGIAAIVDRTSHIVYTRRNPRRFQARKVR